ncbi:ribosome small subunit-dependent GTPase A [Promicromonospora iranensis]|uniref:Small ribosomal subunit biogenesis GTPase RsgA n=1 Tax=Promicromonospora iranensis TaxID=1105144 RepID=A0ABU2CLH5_9MICO|nr:ribosome small subunit-dependent GTPase A [Promicromonospora iranensis]MDR7382195.1 ribosome biogenesis GTPase [Promicromonospora iranensis]
MGRRDIDESDFHSRPTKRGSRPRTKQRPEHSDAVTGLVTGVDRGRYTLLVKDPDDGGGDGASGEKIVTAMKARELTRTRVVVGDRVDVVGDVSGGEGSLARIVRIQERTSTLRRTADDTDPYERIVVANADQLVIVTALAQPEPRTGMIDRCVVAAYDAGMSVLLCLTKADLASPDELRALYEPLGVEVVVTQRAPSDDETDGANSAGQTAGGMILVPESVEEVRERLRGLVSVLVGHSGVGKSTLINALVPAAKRATGVVNDVTGRGRHTSTSAVALALPVAVTEGSPTDTFDGWVIDTPGVRSFGLAHVEVSHLLRAFDDLDEVAQECPRGCTHLADAPDCALDDWIEASPEDERPARAARLTSFRRLLASRTGSDA